MLCRRCGVVLNSARYVVRQQGADPAAWYREQFATPARLELPSGAVIGPAECGNRADAELLWPLLTHPAAGVRGCTATEAAPRRPRLRRPRDSRHPAPLRKRNCPPTGSWNAPAPSGPGTSASAPSGCSTQRRHRGATRGARTAGRPGHEAAHLGRAIHTALASTDGRAAPRPGVGGIARPEPTLRTAGSPRTGARPAGRGPVNGPDNTGTALRSGQKTKSEAAARPYGATGRARADGFRDSDQHPDRRTGPGTTAVAFYAGTGQLTVRPEPAASATKTHLEQARIIEAADTSAGRTVARTPHILPARDDAAAEPSDADIPPRPCLPGQCRDPANTLQPVATMAVVLPRMSRSDVVYSHGCT